LAPRFPTSSAEAVARQTSIEVSVGFASHAGWRPDNQDFAGADLGSVSDRALQGVVVALADGVGGAKGGRVAAELAVRNFIDGYRAQNPLPGIGAAAMSAMSGFNIWLHGQAHNAPDLMGAAATFTGMVLRGREAVVIHIGDSRAWHLRAETLTLLTDDHVSLTPSGVPMLLRALGLEPRLRLDMRRQPLEDQDRLLLTSDGVHGVLSHRAISKLLAARQSPQADADAIVAAAIAAGSSDNATAVIIDIVALPAVDHDALAAEVEGLPLLQTPVEGQTVDGFKLVKRLGDGGHARLFLARDGDSMIV
jgi:serine/threonine protein phosphatase PrpC